MQYEREPGSIPGRSLPEFSVVLERTAVRKCIMSSRNVLHLLAERRVSNSGVSFRCLFLAAQSMGR